MRVLADESAAYIAELLVKVHKDVIVLTHVPPFTAAARYLGEPTEPGSLPFFTNLSMGLVLLKAADSVRGRHITVLCGHTHESAEYIPLPNLSVHVAAAEYGKIAPGRLLNIA